MRKSWRIAIVEVALVALVFVTGGVCEGRALGHPLQIVPSAQACPVSGSEMYAAYCAGCHGSEGRGDGPYARLLVPAPTDLTTLASTHSSGFPRTHVLGTLARGHADRPVADAMPTWGDIFVTIDTRTPALRDLRIRNLTDHIESLQQRP